MSCGQVSPTPKHCPYKAGDRVTLHGYASHPSGHRRTGFTGVVECWRGGTWLHGHTDDGDPWDEHWGWLEPENHNIAKATDDYRCTCHAHLRRPSLQPSLFSHVDLAHQGRLMPTASTRPHDGMTEVTS